MTAEEIKQIQEAKRGIAEMFTEMSGSIGEILDEFAPQMLKYESALRGVLNAPTLEHAQVCARRGLEIKP